MPVTFSDKAESHLNSLRRTVPKGPAKQAIKAATPPFGPTLHARVHVPVPGYPTLVVSYNFPPLPGRVIVTKITRA